MVDSAAPALGRVFISYRREETAYPAGWLYDRLADHYGGGQIFKDVDSIQLGDDFVEVITTAVGSCDVLLALVGDEWLTITDAHGRRRLDDPDDFVRLEIEAALTRNVRVIPILVDGATMPHADELPASLAGLVRRQALELSPARFDFDTSRLLKVLDKTLAEVRTTQAGAVAPDTSGGPDGSVPDSVTLTVENPPRLAVGPATVDFGTVHDPSPQRIIRISNSGGGRLEARASTADSWLHLEQHDDQVLATVDTGTSGELMGAITIAAGEAGTIRIPVTARVEQPPGLVVEPAAGPTPAARVAPTTRRFGHCCRGRCHRRHRNRPRGPFRARRRRQPDRNHLTSESASNDDGPCSAHLAAIARSPRPGRSGGCRGAARRSLGGRRAQTRPEPFGSRHCADL